MKNKHVIDERIQKLFAEHFDAAVYLARKIVMSREEAEDVVQEVFIRMLDVDLDALGSLQGFLYACTRNRALDHARKNARLTRPGLPPEEHDDSPETLAREIEHAESLSKLMKAIEQLPRQSREVVKLVYLSGRSYKETAKHLGISLATVKTHAYRSIKRIRETLSK
ncbi:MAG: sigma-70 family RNA polymerase sigma factor [Odoribacteraceae bacterium]|nr:sigma-70 family RNA polymerase sigma factor [Odoribacteraceae bacterium]